MDSDVKEAFESLVAMCVSMYGPDETRDAMREVADALRARGAVGARYGEWYVMLREVCVRRHPATALVWDNAGIEVLHGGTN